MYKRRLMIIAITTYLLLIPLVTYFKYFPRIVNSEITNVFIFLLVFLLTLLLVYGAFLMGKSTDVYLLLPQSLIFIFIARAVPNLRLSYPPLHDPYYHYICTLNILRYGTLKPILDWWYGGVDIQLHWPDMHLLTTALVHITNTGTMQIFRFQEPVMGIMFFLAVFVLAKVVTKNEGMAMMSALFASLSDVVIFYQSEYHPQGFAIVLLILLLYTFIKSRSVNDIRFRYVTLIFCIVFTLSHYFTPLFLALIFGMYLMVLLIIRALSSYSPIEDKFYEIIEDIRLDYTFLMVIIISALAYHFMVYTSVVMGFIRIIFTEQPLQGQLISIGQSNVPLLTSILCVSKWGLFILAIISILWIIKTKNTNEFRLAVLFVSIIVAGIIGNYVIISPLDRLIGFYVPFAAVFGSLTLFRFGDEWFNGIQKNRKVMVAVLIASILMTAGFFNSQTPAYFFQDSSVNTFYWYSNRLPKMDEYKIAGEWINAYILSDLKIGTEFDTRTVPLFYGRQSYNKVIYLPTYPTASVDYVMSNPNIPYDYKGCQKMYFDRDLNTVYYNGELKIYVPH